MHVCFVNLNDKKSIVILVHKQLLAIEFNLLDAGKLLKASLVSFVVGTGEPYFSEDAIAARARVGSVLTLIVRIAGQVTLVDNIAEIRQQQFRHNYKRVNTFNTKYFANVTYLTNWY